MDITPLNKTGKIARMQRIELNSKQLAHIILLIFYQPFVMCARNEQFYEKQRRVKLRTGAGLATPFPRDIAFIRRELSSRRFTLQRMETFDGAI